MNLDLNKGGGSDKIIKCEQKVFIYTKILSDIYCISLFSSAILGSNVGDHLMPKILVLSALDQLSCVNALCSHCLILSTRLISGSTPAFLPIKFPNRY